MSFVNRRATMAIAGKEIAGVRRTRNWVTAAIPDPAIE
jgi:hypothetical protein